MPGPLGEKEVMRSRQGQNGIFRGSVKKKKPDDFFWENGSGHMATLVLIERLVMLHYPIKIVTLEHKRQFIFLVLMSLSYK